MKKEFSHQDFPGHVFTAYDGPAKNGHLFGLPHNTPDDLPLEIVVVETDEYGDELGEFHMEFTDKFTEIL